MHKDYGIIFVTMYLVRKVSVEGTVFFRKSGGKVMRNTEKIVNFDNDLNMAGDYADIVEGAVENEYVEETVSQEDYAVTKRKSVAKALAIITGIVVTSGALFAIGSVIVGFIGTLLSFFGGAIVAIVSFIAAIIGFIALLAFIVIMTVVILVLLPFPIPII